jgi:hypothetical protein
MVYRSPIRISVGSHGFPSRQLSLLILLLCLSLLRGFLYSVFIPPWQAPDEPGHFEYARLLSEKVWPLTKEDILPSLQREILLSLQEFHFWKYVQQPEPKHIPDSFTDDPFLVRSGTQVGDEPLLYYLFPALIFAVTGPEDIVLQLYIMRWFSVILSSATVVVSYLMASELFSEDRFMILAVPTFITFLPMFTYIGASANNDSLTFLIASLLIWRLVRVLRRGLSWRSGSVICILTLLSVLSKKTFFIVPLVIIAIPTHLWGRRVAIRDAHRTVGGVSIMLATLSLGAVLSWRGGDAASWLEHPEPWMDTRSDSVAMSGMYSLHILDDTPQLDRQLVQSLPFNSVRELRGKTIALNAWVRSSRGKQLGCLLLRDSGSRNPKIFSVKDTWDFQRLTHTVSSRATSIGVVLSAGDCESEGMGDLYFDDVVLVESDAERANLVRNGGGEDAALRVWSRLERLGRHVPLRHLLDARSYDHSSLKRYALYILLTFPGFWANFGWLTLPLDPTWYLLLGLVSLTPVVGLGLLGVSMERKWKRDAGSVPTWWHKSIFLILMAFCLILVQSFLPMVGRDWQPQGRYLFPAIIPIATLFSLGWRQVVLRQWPRLRLSCWIAALFLFDTLCLLGYVNPYFYG